MKRALWILLAIILATATPRAQTISRVTPAAATGTVTAIDAGTCTVTSAGCVVLRPGGFRAISIQVTGTCGTCTLQFEVSLDGVNWAPQNMTPSNSATAVTSTAAVGVWTGAVGPGIFRARLSALASGSFVVTIRASI